MKAGNFNIAYIQIQEQYIIVLLEGVIQAN